MLLIGFLRVGGGCSVRGISINTTWFVVIRYLHITLTFTRITRLFELVGDTDSSHLFHPMLQGLPHGIVRLDSHSTRCLVTQWDDLFCFVLAPFIRAHTAECRIRLQQFHFFHQVTGFYLNVRVFPQIILNLIQKRSKQRHWILFFFTLNRLRLSEMKGTDFWSVTKVKCLTARQWCHFRTASMIAVASFSTAW